MNYSTAKAWFLDVATRLLDIQHTAARRRFYRNVDEIKEEKRSLPQDGVIMVMDEPRGDLSGQLNENILDYNQYGFFILAFVDKNAFDDEDVVYDKCKKTGLKVIGKMLHERKTQTGTFRFTNIDSVNYMKVGPELQNYFGAYFKVQVYDNSIGQLAYSQDDYLEA